MKPLATNSRERAMGMTFSLRLGYVGKGEEIVWPDSIWNSGNQEGRIGVDGMEFTGQHGLFFPDFLSS
jgi:hypothetical protein